MVPLKLPQGELRGRSLGAVTAPMLGKSDHEEVERLGRQARKMWAEFAKTGTPPEPTDWLARPALP